MGFLKEYVNQPKVEINGKLFVDKDITREYIISCLEEEKKDCFSEEEKDGIDMCIARVLNCLKE